MVLGDLIPAGGAGMATLGNMGTSPNLGYVGASINALGQLTQLNKAGKEFYESLPEMPEIFGGSDSGKSGGRKRGRPKGSKNKKTGKASNVKSSSSGTTKQIFTTQGNGLSSGRVKFTGRMKKDKKTFKDKVLDVVDSDKETQTKMFMLRHQGGSIDGSYDWHPWEPDTYYSRLGPSSLFYPTGLSELQVVEPDIKAISQDCGLVIFPSNHVYRAGGAHPEEPETYDIARFNGQSFNLKSLLVDYGWVEGVDYDRSYSRTEVVCGVIKNATKFEEICTAQSWTVEKALNLVLGTKGKVDLSINGSDWPLRSIGDARTVTAADEQLFKDKKRLQGLVKILRRDTNIHRPIQAITADDGDGVERITASQAGRLFGSGSFVFPKEALGKQEVREDSYGTGVEDTRFIRYKGAIPFIHLRGDCEPDNVDRHLPTSSIEAAKAMACCLRFKMSVVDDE